MKDLIKSAAPRWKYTNDIVLLILVATLCYLVSYGVIYNASIPSLLIQVFAGSVATGITWAFGRDFYMMRKESNSSNNNNK